MIRRIGEGRRRTVRYAFLIQNVGGVEESLLGPRSDAGGTVVAELGAGSAVRIA